MTNWIIHIKDVITGHHIIEPARTDQVSVSFEHNEIGGDTRIISGRINMVCVDVDFSPLWERDNLKANIQINTGNNDYNNNYYENCVLNSVNWGIDSNQISTIELEWVFYSSIIPIRQFKEKKLDWRKSGF